MDNNLAACCSVRCEKALSCKRRHISGICEDYYSFGSGGISSTGKIEESYWCGPHGNYNMYIPVDIFTIIEEFDKVIKMSQDAGYPIKLYPESDGPLCIYHNEDYPNMILVDKYLSK